MQYRAPLNVDLPDSVRQEIFKRKRVNAAFAHAKHAARQCATQIIVHGWNPTTHDVESRMASYLVHKPLREYATQLTFEIALQMRAKREGLL